MIKFNKEYFNIEDTLYCGQVFRFRKFERGYLVFSTDKVCYLYYDGDSVCIDSDFDDYFYSYFDLANDYKTINDKAKSFGIDFLTESAESGKGIRILLQNSSEALFSFLVSQNNNIPRIKRTIEGLSENLGKKCTSRFGDYFAFPSAVDFSKKDEIFFKSMGLGYRAKYFVNTSHSLADGSFFQSVENQSTEELRNSLISLKGVGPKVADCVLFFGFNRTDSFPVDTWIEKLYHENLNGELTDRKKISKFLVEKFGKYSGYVQQYLFYHKRGK